MTTRPLYVLAAAAILATPVGAGMTVYLSYLRQQDSCANRRAVVESFDIYTDILVAASARSDRTPEEQADVDAREAKVRADLAERLAPLEEGC